MFEEFPIRTITLLGSFVTIDNSVVHSSDVKERLACAMIGAKQKSEEDRRGG
jgi:hypothetical protein